MCALQPFSLPALSHVRVTKKPSTFTSVFCFTFTFHVCISVEFAQRSCAYSVFSRLDWFVSGFCLGSATCCRSARSLFLRFQVYLDKPFLACPAIDVFSANIYLYVYGHEFEAPPVCPLLVASFVASATCLSACFPRVSPLVFPARLLLSRTSRLYGSFFKSRYTVFEVPARPRALLPPSGTRLHTLAGL